MDKPGTVTKFFAPLTTPNLLPFPWAAERAFEPTRRHEYLAVRPPSSPGKAGALSAAVARPADRGLRIDTWAALPRAAKVANLVAQPG